MNNMGTTTPLLQHHHDTTTAQPSQRRAPTSTATATTSTSCKQNATSDEWVTYQAFDGRPYYVNVRTRQAQWNPPCLSPSGLDYQIQIDNDDDDDGGGGGGDDSIPTSSSSSSSSTTTSSPSSPSSPLSHNVLNHHHIDDHDHYHHHHHHYNHHNKNTLPHPLLPRPPALRTHIDNHNDDDITPKQRHSSSSTTTTTTTTSATTILNHTLDHVLASSDYTSFLLRANLPHVYAAHRLARARRNGHVQKYDGDNSADDRRQQRLLLLRRRRRRRWYTHEENEEEEEVRFESDDNEDIDRDNDDYDMGDLFVDQQDRNKEDNSRHRRMTEPMLNHSLPSSSATDDDINNKKNIIRKKKTIAISYFYKKNNNRLLNTMLIPCFHLLPSGTACDPVTCQPLLHTTVSLCCSTYEATAVSITDCYGERRFTGDLVTGEIRDTSYYGKNTMIATVGRWWLDNDDDGEIKGVKVRGEMIRALTLILQGRENDKAMCYELVFDDEYENDITSSSDKNGKKNRAGKVSMCKKKKDDRVVSTQRGIDAAFVMCVIVMADYLLLRR